MTNWHDYLNRQGQAPPWPYPVDYDKEQEIETDVLVIGGGIAGCWAAISAARKRRQSGAGGKGRYHQERRRRPGLRPLVSVSGQSPFQG